MAIKNRKRIAKMMVVEDWKCRKWCVFVEQSSNRRRAKKLAKKHGVRFVKWQPMVV